MLDQINGLPLHPLVVHAVVVLLPLSILGTLALAARRDWRLRYGWLVVGVAAVATALIPVATASGESLEERVGVDPEQHAALGDQLIWFALPLLALVTVMVWLAHREPTKDAPGAAAFRRPGLARAVTVLAVVAAVAAGVQVYRVGDSGARAAWQDVAAASGGPAALRTPAALGAPRPIG